MNTDRIPELVDGFEAEQLDDEIMLCHQDRETVIHLNATAALIWQLCDGSRSIDQITNFLTHAYPDEADTIIADVALAVQDLIDKGVVTLKPVTRD